MSVTLTIRNNEPYCVINGLVETVTFDCQTCEFDGVSPDCQECHGKGKVEFPELPFERNLANGNFRLVWNALGLDFDYSGEIDAQKLLDALTCADTDLMLRDTRIEQRKGHAKLIDCGISEEQAKSYIHSFRKIAEEAKRRGASVVWG